MLDKKPIFYLIFGFTIITYFNTQTIDCLVKLTLVLHLNHEFSTEALEGHLLLITYCLLFMTYNL